ncbi:uncharacterized protein TNIN_335731 [Trichonephila inaurata madagascariensis]|uniref:Uncharacterized protein n=1 Tax=Trichonephila inaurata madagascariensis TaxID=2747483 RepID=A0A8X6XYY5_9ARAC|nr:uncharacterized protein TNIN_335731 [Trichonephila inaurata madagascariensis]
MVTKRAVQEGMEMLNAQGNALEQDLCYWLLYRMLGILRISLLLNKTRILRVLANTYIFKNGLKNRNRSPLRKYAYLACGLSFLFPLTMITGIISFAVLNIDKCLPSLKVINQNASDKKIQYVLFMTGHAVLYMNHFLLFPGLVMVLLSFMYLSFVKTFRRHLDEMRCRLLEKLSNKEICRALVVFMIAKKIHRDIEKAVSFISFLVYVLIFGRIMQAVSAIISNYMPGDASMQIMHSYFILTSTVMWFVLLTMCGAQTKKIETFIKNMNQEVMTKYFIMLEEGNSDLENMNLLNSCSDIELRFTGWGMFVVDKKLFLTISGVLVTYGVLFATEVPKIAE